MSDTALHLRITGRVQGVWYRGWMVGEADRRGLRGWVRNRADGSVEALVIGPDETVQTLIAACRKGPPAARVDDIAATPDVDDGSAGFRQLPTS